MVSIFGCERPPLTRAEDGATSSTGGEVKNWFRAFFYKSLTMHVRLIDMIFLMKHQIFITRSMAIVFTLFAAVSSAYAGETLRGVIATKDESVPLPHTIIKLKGEQGTKKTQLNSHGMFWFAGLDYGTYELTFEMEGYCTIVRMIHLDGMPIHIRPTPLECCTGEVPTVHVYSTSMTSSNPTIHYDREFIEKFLR